MPENTMGLTPSILVVDDDQRNVRLMESILRSDGYRVLKAFDGDQALYLVSTEAVDLILLDVMMPGMSGFELCRLLRSRYETRLLPIIMVTALNALEDKVRALETGADDFLSKPINKTELLAKARSVLRVKALQDEVEHQKRELEATNERLVRMQCFKEMMVQMVVHDLKNPLAGIMGNIQLLQLRGAQAAPERIDELAQRTLESGRQMTRMVLNILDVGRLEEEKMPLRLEPVVMREVAQEQINEMLSLGARNGIRIENRISDDLPPVHADRELLGRVIANLLNNALKHTPTGGVIDVGARRENGGLLLTVRDTGEGIPEELQPHIFEKFIAGSPGEGRGAFHDSGLGLTFCRLAVERHGGKIWLRSHPDEGTEVFVSLPFLRTDAKAGTGRDSGNEGSRAA